MKSIVFFIVLGFCTFVEAQDIYFTEDTDSLAAIVNYSGKSFLIYKQGTVVESQNQSSINDFYTNYYRKIYNDSTLVNPNFIVENNNGINIYPVINISDLINSNILPIDYNSLITTGNNQFTIDSKNANILGNYLINSLKK